MIKEGGGGKRDKKMCIAFQCGLHCRVQPQLMNSSFSIDKSCFGLVEFFFSICFSMVKCLPWRSVFHLFFFSTKLSLSGLISFLPSSIKKSVKGSRLKSMTSSRYGLTLPLFRRNKGLSSSFPRGAGAGGRGPRNSHPKRPKLGLSLSSSPVEGGGGGRVEKGRESGGKNFSNRANHHLPIP